ncbi:MAG: universal stress protein [Deltaproteobacteria bacterium]|jgi:nucleotide-binding universal stress UspA family protein|nr:universal stress protein [Deltaproteobacteria bacterium]
MTVINKIMVAVDFSDFSVAAARYAAKLARDVKATLLLTHVYNQRDVDMLNMVAMQVPDFSVKKYVGECTDEKKERLRELSEELSHDGGLSVETHLRIGVPYEALLREIDEGKPDLLVMGAKGRSNVIDMILGSCAQKMFRHSPIPLLSIRNR